MDKPLTTRLLTTTMLAAAFWLAPASQAQTVDKAFDAAQAPGTATVQDLREAAAQAQLAGELIGDEVFVARLLRVPVRDLLYKAIRDERRSQGASPDAPIPAAEARAFLVLHYGAGGAPATELSGARREAAAAPRPRLANLPKDASAITAKLGKLGTLAAPQGAETTEVFVPSASAASKPDLRYAVVRRLPVSNYVPAVDAALAAAKKQGLDPSLYAAQLWEESGFNQRAFSGVAYGVAQFIQATAATYAVKMGLAPKNARTTAQKAAPVTKVMENNVKAGALYMKDLLAGYKVDVAAASAQLDALTEWAAATLKPAQLALIEWAYRHFDPRHKELAPGLARGAAIAQAKALMTSLAEQAQRLPELWGLARALGQYNGQRNTAKAFSRWNSQSHNYVARILNDAVSLRLDGRDKAR